MRKTAILFLALLLTAAFSVSATDVVEAAKKERARREALKKEGRASKTFTNQDISELKSTLAFESTTPAEPTEAAQPSSQITTIPAVEPAPEPAVAEDRQNENDEEVQKLKDEREALEQQARDADQTIQQGGGYHTRNIGSQFKAKREAEARIREIDDELAKKEGSEEDQEQ